MLLYNSLQMIIDFHSHVYPPTFAQRREELSKSDVTFDSLYSNPHATIASANELICRMNDSEIDAAVVMGIGWTNLDIAKEANDYILETAQENPDRLIPFCSLNPAWGDDAIKELERCTLLGAKGVGELHPDTQGFDISDKEQMRSLMEAAKALGLIVLVHSSEPVGHLYPGKGTTTPGKLWRFIKNFSDNPIVCAHWGGGLPFYALMPEVAESMTNVYFDTAASPFLYKPSIFETTVNILGPRKILMGTDYPLIPQTRVLSEIDRTPLPRHVKELILGHNAKALLNI